MKQNNTAGKSGTGLRYGMLVPLALMIASVISCCASYSDAKQSIADDLNEAVLALANENCELWTRPDTIAAIRQMYTTTRKPLIYQASDANFKTSGLKEEAYITLAVVDKKNAAPEIRGDKIASDSIMLVPERSADGVAVHVRGFADCSMASVFRASDRTLPGVLLSLSILSTGVMYMRKRRMPELITPPPAQSLDGIKLTPMQRRLALMLLDAPDMRVDKRTLCETLWGDKSNAEESLYTLVRRTKTALAESDMEIVCNRGESYELRINS